MTDKPESETTAGLLVGEVLPAKLYAERNSFDLDRAGGYHMRHRVAMTAEGLHSKGDIADELGWRDQQIDAAQATIVAQAAEIERLKRERDEANEARWQAQRESADLKERVARIAHEMRLERSAELSALKAKQVADIDEVMRLAGAYADAAASDGFNSECQSPRTDAAREALRLHLAKDRA